MLATRTSSYRKYEVVVRGICQAIRGHQSRDGPMVRTLYEVNTRERTTNPEAKPSQVAVSKCRSQ